MLTTSPTEHDLRDAARYLAHMVPVEELDGVIRYAAMQYRKGELTLKSVTEFIIGPCRKELLFWVRGNEEIHGLITDSMKSAS